MKRATCFAPATIANVAVGFDVLGFAFGELGDVVTVARVDGAVGVILESIESDEELPTDPDRNTATRAVAAMVKDLGLTFGFRIWLKKGIPLGSGMGGSAASAVGAVVAAGALLEQPLPKERLLKYALAGEAVASGGVAHGDNVAPCLFGGLCSILPGASPRVVELPIPDGLFCVLVRPRLRRDTDAQRSLLAAEVPLADYVEQSAHLAAFVAACYRSDVPLLRASMQDLWIAPQRAPTIPGFADARAAAMAAGAIGCSLAGSGPSLFAWVSSKREGEAVRDAVLDGFRGHDVTADAWIAPLASGGARIT